MKVLLVVTAVMFLASADSVSQKEEEFQNWKLKFGKSYKSEKDKNQHKNTWLENYNLVQNHNMLADQGTKSYRLSMNYFADMSNQEYKESFSKGCLLTFNRTKNHSAAAFLQQTGGTDLPQTVNWIDKGYVTDVKDQKNCCSCWAFSATGALEGQIFKKTGKLPSLSEQQLVDCSHEFGNRGCYSGMVDWAFKYVKENGLQTEDSYPFEATDGTCRYNPASVEAISTGYVDIMREDEDALQEAVATIGPISVAISTSHESFRFYESGMYDEPECSSSNLTHAVLAVGYGTDDGKDYWLVKNSWGLDWGEKGYIRMSRNKNNQCGIATAASYPLVSNKTQRVQCEACSAILVLGYFLLNMFY